MNNLITLPWFRRVLLIPFLLLVTAFIAQSQKSPWAIPFEGMHSNHEGCVGWDADGTGPEPYGVGHNLPWLGYLNMYYYIASCDYGGIDPDPGAALGHLEDGATGFPAFLQEISEQGYTLSQVKIKFGIASLEEDLEGYDWFILPDDWSHSLYYDEIYTILLDGEEMISGSFRFGDVYSQLGDPMWSFETSFSVPDSAWESASEAVKAVGRAFFTDLGGEEIRFTSDIFFSGVHFTDNGRDGDFWEVSGQIEKGRPELPFIGFADEHQGMAGWNADGTGPEPSADGHGAQRYYIASRDYDDIDPDPDAAFGHFLPEMTGFMNLSLQMAYRGYSADQLVIKMGLSSLGEDIMGQDWGFDADTNYWCNYYDLDYVLELGGENIIRGMLDTSVCWMVEDPLYWWTDATEDKPRDHSSLSSDDAKIVATAFLKDLEDRHMINDVSELQYDPGIFSGNGRYDGGFFNVAEARLIAKFSDACTFIQSDTLGGGFIGEVHWTQEHSPYFIDNDIVVHDGATLIIDPGVTVAVRGPYHIQVGGSLQASGQEGDSILFTRSNPLLKWTGIRFESVYEPADSSIFEYCIFEHGFTNTGFPDGFNSGGALKTMNCDEMRISHCLFRYNEALYQGGVFPPTGGALALWSSSPEITDCTFEGNISEDGGAIHCYLGSAPLIHSCKFIGNHATDRGGAILCYDGGNPIIEQCEFIDNYAATRGGAISIEGVTMYSNPVIRFSLFEENTAHMRGGGISISETCSPLIVNNTFTGNTVEYDMGGGLAIGPDAEPTVVNNIFWGNLNLTVTLGNQIALFSDNYESFFIYNDVQGGAEDIGPYPVPNYDGSNIDEDPLFCAPWELDYHLADLSPCYDYGFESSFIGAYDSACIFTREVVPPNAGDCLSVYPNPVSGEMAVIGYNLPADGLVIMEIYDLLGNRVAGPISKWMTAGDHTSTISLAGLPAGTYVCRLVAGDPVFTAKMVRLK